MYPQLPSQTSTLDSPVGMLRFLQCLNTLFYEQTQTEQIPFVLNEAAASEDVTTTHEWATPAALAERAEFARWAEGDEVVIPPRGYTPPPTVGVIGVKPTRAQTPAVKSNTQLDSTRQNLLDLLLYGPSVTPPSAPSTPSRTGSSTLSATTSSIHTPEHNSPAKAKNVPLKGEDDSDLFKRLEDFLDTIIADDVVAV